MPRRSDLRKVLVLGSGPIAPGQGPELEYAAVQACRALGRAGIEVVVVNSNAATLMTDPDVADRAYVEPLTPEYVAKVLERERPDALLPGVGGANALDVTRALALDGTLARFGVELLGVAPSALSEPAHGPRPPAEDAGDWRRFEVEVARDVTGAVAVLGTVESVDPLGAHPADAVAVAPIQGLGADATARLVQAAAASARDVDLEAGVVNVQLALHRRDGRLVVLESSFLPSPSSPLAAKAARLPIAGIAATLAVGFTLDELTGDRMGRAAGSGRCAVRLPRGPLGAVITLGRTFREAFGKALRALGPHAARATRARRPIPARRASVVVLGPGTNAIGEGAELGACCVEAAAAVRAAGLEAVIVDAGAAAVSTDPDAADRVWVEPITLEDVVTVVEAERPLGVIVQFGGRTALELAGPLAEAGVPLLGTPAEAIERAEDRQQLAGLLDELGLTRPAGATVDSLDEARILAARLGYPVVVRPSHGLGGRGVAIARDEAALVSALSHATRLGPGRPSLVAKFLEEAIEVDVDALSDGQRVLVAGVMEHVERAGIHSGDAACALPPYSLPPDQDASLRRQTEAIARALGIVGLVNVRFAIKNDLVYVLDVNPHASRTVPFVSKAVGTSLARLATQAMLGHPLPSREPATGGRIAVREAVFPFLADGSDVVLGPEMKSTGAAMGVDVDFRRAYLRAQLAAGVRLPTSGKVWIAVRGSDRRPLVMLAKRLAELGFALVATGDTARVLARHGVAVERPPDGDDLSGVLELIRRGEITLVIDVPEDGRPGARSAAARRQALGSSVPHYTTLDGAQAAVAAIEVLMKRDVEIAPLEASR